MDQLVEQLDASQCVLDLGSGGGSFDYTRYRCRIVGLDFSFPQGGAFDERRKLDRVGFCRGLSHQLPFRDGVFDAVICHNTMEHFEQLDATLAEIQRVTHAGSQLYVAVPNGYGFDDGLYRFITKGGGHVNRFRFEDLRSQVEQATRFRLRSFKRLYSSFIYMNRPRKEVLIYLPKLMWWYYHLLPEPVVRLGMFGLNGVSRAVDAIFKKASGQYGWAFYFQTAPGPLVERQAFTNVCMKCGCGNSADYLRQLKAVSRGWPKFYRCPACQSRNLFFK